MKIIMLSVMASSFWLISCSQDIPAANVPSIVQNALQSKFVDATDIEWEKKKNFYEAEFDMNNIDHKAHIDPNGHVIMYKMEIRKEELPQAVASAISRGHAGYDIDDAEKMEKDGMTYYQVELDAKGKKDKKLVYTTDGDLAQNISYML